MADLRGLILSERTTEATARAQVERLVAEQVDQARARTNEAVHRARHSLGITVTALTEQGFGNTNRAAVMARLAEHETRHGVIKMADEDGNMVTVNTETDLGLFVTTPEDRVVVTMREFTHPDIGNMVSGEVVYNEDGDMIEYSDDMADLMANPLFPMILWGLDEVQRQL